MLRVGLAGCGFMGRMHAAVYAALAGAKLAACTDAEPSQNGRALAQKFEIPYYASFEEMLDKEQIDFVDICLPTFLHKEYTVAAAARRKHVFCEKPMAMTLKEADEMIEACSVAGVRLMIAHCIRFWPEYRILRETA